MKLITKEIAKASPALYATEDVSVEEKLLLAKFFYPAGRGTWYLCEYDPAKQLAFGYCVSPIGPDCDEWGYFSMIEMERLRSNGLGIERDLHFQPVTFSNL